MAAVAEHEAKAISERTKAALAAVKVRGKKLGGYRGAVMTAKIRAAGRKRLIEQANARAADLAPVLEEIRASGITSLSWRGREDSRAAGVSGMKFARRCALQFQPLCRDTTIAPTTTKAVKTCGVTAKSVAHLLHAPAPRNAKCLHILINAMISPPCDILEKVPYGTEYIFERLHGSQIPCWKIRLNWMMIRVDRCDVPVQH